MKIYHAQVNHLENPVGFRMETDGLFVENKRSERKAAELRKDPCIIGCRRWNICCLTPGRMTKASSLCYPVKLKSGAENTVLLERWKQAAMPEKKQ